MENTIRRTLQNGNAGAICAVIGLSCFFTVSLTGFDTFVRTCSPYTAPQPHLDTARRQLCEQHVLSVNLHSRSVFPPAFLSVCLAVSISLPLSLSFAVTNKTVTPCRETASESSYYDGGDGSGGSHSEQQCGELTGQGPRTHESLISVTVRRLPEVIGEGGLCAVPALAATPPRCGSLTGTAWGVGGDWDSKEKVAFGAAFFRCT